MNSTWEAWGGVITATIAALPLAGCVAWWLARRRGSWRNALCEVGVVVGTAPWLWMILTPVGAGRSVNVVPLRDLIDQMRDDRVVEQLGGNLLVFAALGFLLPMRWAWFADPWRRLLVGAVLSSVVEVSQFALCIGRHSSVDDVLVNAIGAVLAGLASNRWWASNSPATPHLG
ncbi:VanZ family protein [Nocardia vinacea]|uniref:VanZ family protein n=1 Tax=Nocardia vinacea TaxID=96468 RepID=A0ABZ1Z1D8_9NOCA|nr:VanZ family protein [Nocardia vinacea]